MVISNNILRSLITLSIFLGTITANALLLQDTSTFIYDTYSDLSESGF